MLGALHIELAIDTIEGEMFECSGMAAMACKAGILTTGRTESFLSQPDHHLKRTRYMHRVNAISENEAYDNECSGIQ